MEMQLPFEPEGEAAPSFRCMSCGSAEVHASRVRSAFWHDDRLVVVEGIPALVCERCGDQFYDDRTAIGLDILRGGGFPAEQAVRTVEVAVFDYGEAPAVRNVS
ncbi:YgiT-type zinc finger protein [Piscinibacter gummiphilus]|uniref:YgiT-type zinc finger protein n=1 Tax=Piscinibacter gummiphilus TaxID=946333 RepID=A0ABZ0D046_9BURK|nr:YgiT-type zinc finger protein [Piscinibacter gummiphilus]WOB10612.1 YgiT-type zinc finger protein [Piscinibacter gummiphilus]